MRELALTEKEEARWVALRAITNVLNSVTPMNGTDWSFMSNQFMSDKKKKLAKREVDNILWQLNGRYNKLDMKIGG